jgi:hypothetical protein
MIFRTVVWFPNVTSNMRSLRQSTNNLFQQRSLWRGDGDSSCSIKRELIEGRKQDEVSHWYHDHGRKPDEEMVAVGLVGRCLDVDGGSVSIHVL